MLRGLATCARGYARARKLDGVPIVIGGCERSGTTLLTSMLSAHPRVHAISRETWAFCYGPEAGFDSRIPIRPVRLYRRLGEGRTKGTARRWAEKSPANIFYFDQIRDFFGGRVHLIQVVRDGRDVVLSENPKNPGEPWTPPRRWKQAVSAGLAYLDDPGVLTIRYRDLVLDFRAQAKRICRFIGEPLAPEVLDWHDHATIRRSSNLNGNKVPRLHTESLRKFERPGCKYADRAEAIMADPEAVELLAAHGFEALAHLDSGPPNRVSCDMDMPTKEPRAEIQYDGYNFHFPCDCIYVLDEVRRGRWIFCEDHPEGPPPTESFVRSFHAGLTHRTSAIT